ncbi:MAG: type VII toxin-antitoxin system MntA family adenylyltransferase antitoxin [Desulfuromonadaceae bacterium]
MEFEQIKTELADVFLKYHKEIISAYLFGSTAKGAASSSSDIDIALLLHKDDNISGAALKFSLYADMCRTLKRNDIDILLLNFSGNLILNDEIIRHGKVLYSTDDEARDVFELNVLHRSTDFKHQRLYALGV